MQSTRKKSESEIKFIEFSLRRLNVFALCEKEAQKQAKKKNQKNNGKKEAKYSPCHLIEYF